MMYKLTNKEGKSIEFDGGKYGQFLDSAKNGHCGGIACSHNACPIFVDEEGDKCTDRFRLKHCTLEPIEKTYNLLELEEGFEYSCDEASHGSVYRRHRNYLQWRKNNGEWGIVEQPFMFKSFRKIKNKLTFADLEVGSIYACKHGDGRELLAIRGEIAIFWEDISKTTGHFSETYISDWTKQ